MSQQNAQFNAAKINAKFQTELSAFDNLLNALDSDQTKAIQTQLHKDLADQAAASSLSLAFVGQYSAGKSTIISALTGRRDIHIDADIATDKTTSYDWNSIRLIDTPGLFTDRPDHDAITYEAIAKSNLLVFCLTSMLFDDITVENFKTLAYDKQYRSKILLVINKLSAEATEDEAQLIANYRESLAAALAPHSLDDFAVCFIDAKDYCDGIDEDDEDLLEFSRFDSFIETLNQFVQQQGVYARLDTPIRTTLRATDETLPFVMPNETEEELGLELLKRASVRVEQERDRLRTQVENLKQEASGVILQSQYPLLDAIGTESQAGFEKQSQQAESDCEKQMQQTEKKLQHLLEKAQNSLRQEIQDVIDDKLFQQFLASLSTKYDQNRAGCAPNADPGSRNAIQFVKGFQTVAYQVGATVSGLASNGTSAGSFLFKSAQVSGSGLHETVYGVGKAIGFKFKPWQAVNIAKGMGNFAKFVPVAMAVVGIGIQIAEHAAEKQRERELNEARREIRGGFTTVTTQLEQQVDQQLNTFEQETYNRVQTDLAQSRTKMLEQMAATSDRLQKLTQIQANLRSLLTDIQSLAQA